jgi:hypothetical protein
MIDLAYLLHFIIFLLAHIYSYALDHTKPEFEELTEQAQAKNLANSSLDQGKPWCISPMLLVFYFESFIYVPL